jgi:hypothetical protein
VSASTTAKRQVSRRRKPRTWDEYAREQRRIAAQALATAGAALELIPAAVDAGARREAGFCRHLAKRIGAGVP